MAQGYQNDARQLETPPFAPQDNFHEVTCEGQTVIPHIDAKIEKGFFYSQDRCWTCYRRNYFSVQCSYTIAPHIPNARLYLNRGAKGGPEQIQALSMSLAAAVDGAIGKSIELVQHTPKRDKGPQLPMKKEKLAPTPPGKPHHQTDPHGYPLGTFHHHTSSSSVLASPLLPLQNDAADQQGGAFGGQAAGTHSSPTAHQHTFERIQFKSATANNGKRRAQQQYYHLIVELYADVRGPRDTQPNWVKLAHRVSAAVVVRGRSPSHYSNEGPHSASSSRGGSQGGTGPAGGSGGMNMGSGVGGGSSAGRGYAGSSAQMSSSLYRGSQYSLDPSPTGSHSVSSASSIADGVVGEAAVPSSSSEAEETHRQAIEAFDGYQYYPSPLYETGLPPSGKVERVQEFEDRRVKHELSDRAQALASAWHFGGCGRFQGTDTSRGYYPDVYTGY